MRIFVTGASGFIGSAVTRELLDNGHQVTGLARSDASAAALEEVGAAVRRGALDDLDSLRAGAADADGVIHLAFTNLSATTDFDAACAADRAAITAIGETLAGSGAPFVVTSGTALAAHGTLATEESAESDVLPRGASEPLTLGFADRGVRAVVLRLPPSVHGRGDHGFVPELIGIARRTGVAGYVGDGGNRWPAVHRLDAARLYRLAVEQAPPGARLHAVDDEGVPFREIAALIGRHLDLPARSVEPDHFGWMAHFAAVDNPSSSTVTRKAYGWEPAQPGLLDDLDAGHYFAGG
jgi:nucleoside-diphosphate-sugar epimerase